MLGEMCKNKIANFSMFAKKKKWINFLKNVKNDDHPRIYKLFDIILNISCFVIIDVFKKKKKKEFIVLRLK